jgi:hypothetical protein
MQLFGNRFGWGSRLEPLRAADPSAPRTRLPQPFYFLRRVSIVVVGILCAFALESWWSGRFEHVETRANLAAMRENFRQNHERLDSVSSMLFHMQAAAAELMQIAGGSTPRPSSDSISSLVASTFRLAGLQPVTSAYDNLINARDLRLVKDHELRLSLAAFASQLGWLREVERWQNDQWIYVNQAFLNQWVEVSDLSPYWLDMEARSLLRDPHHRTVWEVVLGERMFRNIVMHRMVAANDLMRTQASLRQQVDGILLLLEKALH